MRTTSSGCAEKNHDFINTPSPLDSETLLAHFSGLGFGDEARVIVAVAAQDHRGNPESSPAEAVHSWWHFYNLMDESIAMLQQQRDEQLRYFIDHPDDQAACDRLARSSELLWRARQGEYGGAES